MTNLTEIEKVRENLNIWLIAFNAKDIDKLLSLYDADSIYANASAPLMSGIEEIKLWYEKAFSMVNGTLLFKEEKAFQDGNLALLVGKYYFKPLSEDTSDVENATGRVALVYRKSQDNIWRLLFDMDNTPPDVKPEDFA